MVTLVVTRAQGIGLVCFGLVVLVILALVGAEWLAHHIRRKGSR